MAVIQPKRAFVHTCMAWATLNPSNRRQAPSHGLPRGPGALPQSAPREPDRLTPMSAEENKDAESTEDEAGEDKPKLRPLNPFQLDLTVEEVEERISPGETNVFDK